MPANLTPEYKKAEEAFRQAKTREEKIAALEHMMAVIPKHKGTDHLQGDLKRKLSKLRGLDEKKGGKRSDPYRVKREGSGQAIIVGAPNSGKSSLLAALTNAKPEIAPYPFSTTKPLPGMMDFEDILIQLVDTAPVTSDRVETYHSNLPRGADLILCAIDLAAPDPVAQFREVESIFNGINISFAPETPADQFNFGKMKKQTLLVVCKYDLDESDILFGAFRDAIGGGLPTVAVSAETRFGIEELRRAIFDALHIIRVYSKIPGRPPDMKAPFVLPLGSTVLEVARAVHNEFVENLKYARIWGSQKFDGQMVQRDYVVKDKDIIELHM
jgi:uncharacterized protein